MSEEVQLKEVSDSIPKNQETIENNDFQKKLEILNNSDLKEMNWFSSFINYLNQRKSNNSYEEINIVVSLINNGKIDNLIAYFDIDAGKWFFVTPKLFEEFKSNFKDFILLSNANQNKEKDTQNKEKDTQNKKEKNKEKNKWEVDINLIHNEYKDLISILNNHNFDKSIINEIKSKWWKIDSIEKITSVDQFSEIRKVLEENKDDIIKIIKKDAEETGNTEDLRKIADSFKSLGIIDDKKYTEIYDFARDIDKKGEIQTKSLSETQKELAIWYTTRWDTLYKSDDKTSFTIHEWKITSVSKDSWFKLTDYSTLDEDGKKLTEKMKLEAEIKELTSDLTGNKNKKGDLDRLESTPKTWNQVFFNDLMHFILTKYPIFVKML